MKLSKKWANITLNKEQRDALEEGPPEDVFPAYVAKEVEKFLEERRATGYSVHGQASDLANDVEDFLHHWGGC